MTFEPPLLQTPSSLLFFSPRCTKRCARQSKWRMSIAASGAHGCFDFFSRFIINLCAPPTLFLHSFPYTFVCLHKRDVPWMQYFSSYWENKENEGLLCIPVWILLNQIILSWLWTGKTETFLLINLQCGSLLFKAGAVMFTKLCYYNVWQKKSTRG